MNKDEQRQQARVVKEMIERKKVVKAKEFIELVKGIEKDILNEELFGKKAEKEPAQDKGPEKEMKR